jgi:hypothetical protein
LDIDRTGIPDTVTIKLGASLSSGQLSFWQPPPDSTQQLINGTISWDNIRYDTDDIITLIACSPTLLDDTTGQIVIGGGPSDLIVTTDFTLTSNLTVNNVDIQSTGNLTINAGVTLFVRDNFNVDGTLNGQSGTVDFNAGGNTLQLITGTTNPAEFYNVIVSNTTNDGVRAEIDINLNNTLLLQSNSLFDTDGLINDKNFTLVSTPTYTARIGPMGDGAELRGEVIWQRSLRTGPAGYRSIGTPIKGQTIANISDDIWIQGVAERYPNNWTNVATYNEPVGTTGANGIDGWNFYSSLSDNFDHGIGTRLYLWDIDYNTEQVLINKGLPVIGNGGDGVAVGGETYSFTLSFTSSAYDGGGWNLLANPYPCELDWDNVTKSGIDGNSVYVYNPGTQSYGTYSSPLGIGVGGASRYVSSGQGFFVKASSGASTLSVSEASKATVDGNTFLRIASARTAQSFPQINVMIKTGSYSDETAVAFTENSTDGYDQEYDARKLGGGWVNLSTKLDEEKLVAINAMGSNGGVQVVKLNIEAYAYGNSSLSFPTLTGFEEGTQIMLRDKYLDKTVAVNGATTYSFKTEQNKPETIQDRFELQFLSPLKFGLESVTAKAGREFVVPVYADQIADIISAQVGLSWDTETLSFVGIESTGEAGISDFDLSEVESGKLVFMSTSETPMDLPDGAQLFSIRFKALGGQPQASLKFDEQKTQVKAINDIEMPFSTKDLLLDIMQNKQISGRVATYKGVAIDQVQVKAEGEELIEQDTDQEGSYSLDTYEQSGYTVSASRTDNAKLNEAVTTLDIIAARRHILQVREFSSPYQAISADVNMSKSVTALDLIAMRRIVLGIDGVFRDGVNWLFIPTVYDLSNNPFDYSTNLDVSLDQEDMELDFVAVKLGDVNGSWNGPSSGRKSSEEIELNFEPTLNNEIIEVPIVAKDFKGVSGYQFGISWDPTQLQYEGVENMMLEGHFNEELTDRGMLTTMWDEANGKATELADGSVIFIIKFTARSQQAKSTVELNSTITPIGAYDGNMNEIRIKSTTAEIDLESLRRGGLELYQNVPNPFDNSTEISFKIPKSGKVRLTVVNMLGEIIYVHEQDYRAGSHSIDWSRAQYTRQVSSGVYMYRLESNGVELVKKMLVR